MGRGNYRSTRSGKLLSFEENQSQYRGNDKVQSYDCEAFWNGNVVGDEGSLTSRSKANFGGGWRVGYFQYVSYYLSPVGQDEPGLDLNEVCDECLDE